MATNLDWCLLEVAFFFFFKKITERVSNSQFYTLIFNNQWYSHCYRQSLFLIKSIFQSSVLREYNLDSGFQWFLGLQSSLSSINADLKAENFAFYIQMFSISLGTTVIPRRNWAKGHVKPLNWFQFSKANEHRLGFLRASWLLFSNQRLCTLIFPRFEKVAWAKRKAHGPLLVAS